MPTSTQKAFSSVSEAVTLVVDGGVSDCAPNWVAARINVEPWLMDNWGDL